MTKTKIVDGKKVRTVNVITTELIFNYLKDNLK